MESSKLLDLNTPNREEPKKVGKGWLVGDRRLSEKIVERLEQLELVEESFVRGEPVLQLTIVGQAIEARLLH